ncbi:MAG: glycosyltransferase [Victivallales bacterium]|nr:glycosyltransferase [Victivallales bacterium]
MSKILSIIVPSYNMERYLPKCLGSLIVDEQDLLRKLDVIVVNDGSNDRTSEIAHVFAKKYPNVFRVIDKTNGNYGSCVNVGLKNLKGEFVKVLDADDCVNTSAFKNLLRTIDCCEKDVDLVVTEFYYVAPDGHKIQKSIFSLSDNKIFTLNSCLASRNDLSLHAIAYRSNIFKHFKYQQTEQISYTDLEWRILPMAYVRKGKYISDAVYHYLIGRDGQTVNEQRYNRNFHMISTIALKLAQEWNVISSSGEKTSLKYVHHEIYNLLGLVYSANLFMYWLKGGYPFPNDNIDYFESKLQEISPILYDEIANWVLPSRFFHCYPVRSYRKWHTRYTPSLIFYSLYYWLVAHLRQK